MSLASGNWNADDSSKCNLMGPFGIVIQLSLMVFCGVTLFYKRKLEKPKRSMQVF